MIRGFSTSITSDPVFCALSPMAQLLYFKLYMHPGNHLCGLFAYSAAHMAVDIQASTKDATDALDALVGAGFVEVDRACNLVWIPEMAARVGDVTGEKNKLAPAIKKYLKGVCPRKSALVDRVWDTLFNTLSDTITDRSSDTPADRGSDRSLLGSVSGSGTESGSGRKEDPPAKPVFLPSKPITEPQKPLQALAALVQGIDPAQDPEQDGWANAWSALQCRSRSLTTTGLPANVESGWFGVWRDHLAKVATPPTADDMRKFGRWWKAGGASETRKAWFAQLGDVGRMTDWFSRSQAWDGVSAPNGKRDGPKPSWKADPTIGTDRGLPSEDDFKRWNG